jgi:hypothetical protein
MFWPFNCKHPFSALATQKEQTEEIINADFKHVTYHLVCHRCGKKLNMKHAKIIGGVKDYLNRG